MVADPKSSPASLVRKKAFGLGVQAFAVLGQRGFGVTAMTTHDHDHERSEKGEDLDDDDQHDKKANRDDEDDDDHGYQEWLRLAK